MSKLRTFIVGAGIVVGTAVMAVSFANAQAKDVVTGPAPSTAGVSTAAVKVYMPLAAPAQFAAGEKLASTSSLAGVKAASAGFSGGSSGGPQLSAPSVDAPSAFGTSTAPYTTARAAVTVLGPSNQAFNTPVSSYPYRATGKLYFQEGYIDLRLLRVADQEGPARHGRTLRL